MQIARLRDDVLVFSFFFPFHGGIFVFRGRSKFAFELFMLCFVSCVCVVREFFLNFRFGRIDVFVQL